MPSLNLTSGRSLNSQVSGAIAFHDTASDSIDLQNPVFRQIVSRAVYQGMVKYFADRDGDPSPTLLPEPPAEPRARSNGDGTVPLSWSAPPFDSGNGLLGDAATGYRVYTSSNGLGWNNGTVVASTSWTDTSATLDTVRYYRITATNAGGESFPTQVLASRPSPEAATTVRRPRRCSGRSQSPLLGVPVHRAR